MNFNQRKRQEFQKSLGVHVVSYTCPICISDYRKMDPLWTHMKENHRDHLGPIDSRSSEGLARDRWKQKAIKTAEDQASTRKLDAAERAGGTGRQTNQRTPPPLATPPTAPDTSEGTLICSPGAVQPGSEDSTAASRDNPRKRRPSGPDLASPEGNFRASRSPRSASRARHAKSPSSDQTPGGTDLDYQRSQTATLRSGAPRPLFNYKAEDSVGGNIPQKPLPAGVSTPSRGGILNYPKASQYDSSKAIQSNRPADLGAIGHVPSGREPRTGKGTKPSPQRILRNNGTDDLDEPEGDTSMLRQPETRPISHDQLVVEVKGIYAGLVMVEAKCIEVDERQKVGAQNKEYAGKNPVTSDQWRSLIALHKQLLHEHHDFFLASQHPSASNNLSRLAAKYIMPARMWRHGIHGFLEVLRHRLPGSLDHMLAFIYIAYNMMALLFETVPSFEDTWIECLGDLGRYRMAIEDDEPRDREVWSNVARYWYSKASDKSPITGRLYHHLAILARPNTLEHLSLYMKALTCIVPFESAKGSILTLLNPILSGKVSVSPRNLQVEILIIKIHAILFTQRRHQYNEVIQLSRSIHDVLNDFLYHTDGKGRADNVGRVKKIGAYLAIANVSGILEYGANLENGTPRSLIRREHDAMNVRKGEEFAQREEEAPGDTFMQNSHDTINIFELTTRMDYHSVPLSPKEQDQSSTLVSYASKLAFAAMKYFMSDVHWNTDAQIWTHLLPFHHIMLVFIRSCCEAGTSINIIERFVPWADLCVYLNKLADKGGGPESFVTLKDPFPKTGASDGRPVWEDFLLRGLPYTLWYFPKNWFSRSGLDEEERQLDLISMDAARIARILWLGLRIASCGKWIVYDPNKKTFGPTDRVTEPAYAESRMQISGDDLGKDGDSIMSDVSIAEALSSSASIAPSDAMGCSSSTSLPATIDERNQLEAANTGPGENQSTPKIGAADEPKDTPMVDLSPSKEMPPPLDDKPLPLEEVPSNNALYMVTTKMHEIPDLQREADDPKVM